MKYEMAIEAYDKAIAINPMNAASWNNKGFALNILGRNEEAIEAYNKAIEIDPMYANAWNNKGLALYTLSLYERAIEAYDKAIEINPKHVDAWNNKGLVLYILEKYEKAIKAFNNAIKIDPKHDDAWNNKGFAFIRLGKCKEAIKVFKKAIEINPKQDDAWNGKGLAFYDLGKYEEAIIAFNNAIEINPEYANAWNGKGLAFYKLGKYEEAKKVYNKAIEIDPKHYLAHYNLGELFFNIENLEDTSEEVKHLFNMVTDKARALAFILEGRIKIEEHDYNNAAKSFKKAISFDMNNPLILLWEAYANYLYIQFSSSLQYGKNESLKITENVPFFREGDKIKSTEINQEKIISIIRKLEKAEKLSEKKGDEVTRTYVLYFLGYFYYMVRDIFTAKEKLEECVRSKSKFQIEPPADKLLEYVWNYEIRPTWINWWFASPLHRWTKRGIFLILSLSIFLLILLHPFIIIWFPSLQINWILYYFFIVILIIILISPRIERFTAKDFEIQIYSPPLTEFILSPATMEIKIEKLEERTRLTNQ